MKIYIHELTDLETELDFTQQEEWVRTAVERVDEKSEPDALEELLPKSVQSHKSQKAERPIRAHFNLRKVDDVVVINGDIETKINLLCSRCASPFQFGTAPHFSALFCKDPVMAGIGHLETQQGVQKPAGQNKGFARHAHDDSADETGQDLDITYLSQDFIELGDVLTEQLQLQVPFQPLCKESCQGMCSQCGADLNVGRCACAKLAKQTPFSVLKNLKL